MATKKVTTPTPAELRRDLQRQIDELDRDRVAEVLAIFKRDGVAQAVADLKALSDETDPGATQRSASADANALIANMVLPLENGPFIATQLLKAIDQRLGRGGEGEGDEAAPPVAQ